MAIDHKTAMKLWDETSGMKPLGKELKKEKIAKEEKSTKAHTVKKVPNMVGTSTIKNR